MKLKRYYGLAIMQSEGTEAPELKQINKILNTKTHNKFEGKVLELGWNSAIHVIKYGEKLQLLEAYSFQEDISKFNTEYLHSEASDSIIGTHVVTRGVCTCTFVYLHNDVDYWLFHLDMGTLNNNKIKDIFNRLNEICRIGESQKYKCLISHIDEEEENNFMEYLQSNNCIEEIYEFNRGTVSNLVCHIEIGIYANSGDPILYGDCVRDMGVITKFENSCIDESIIDMLNYTSPPASSSGCCVII